MIDFVESHNIAGFRGRAVHNVDGSVTFRLKRAAYVRLWTPEWQEVLQSLRTRTAKTRKAMKLAWLLQIPFTIMLLVILSALDPGGTVTAAIDGVPKLWGYPAFGKFMILLTTCGMPTWVTAIHVRNSRRVQRDLHRELAKRPRCAAPTAGRAEINTLERIGLIVLLPNLMISTFVAAYPSAFRNTPLMGQQIELWNIVAVAVVVGLAIWRRRSLGVLALKKRGARADVIAHGSRRSDPIARARLTNETV